MSDADFPSLSNLHIDGLTIFYSTIAVVLQSVFFGIHLLIMPLGLYIVIKRGSRSRLDIYLSLTILGPFLSSATYWVLRLVDLLLRIQMPFIDPIERNGANFTGDLPLFNAVFLANFLISDAIVIWRAWVICKDDMPQLLLIPLVSLAMTTLTITSIIGLRVAGSLDEAVTKTHGFADAINSLQILYFTCSSVSNFSATSIIGIKAWHHRRLINAGIRTARNKRTRGEQILMLLIESGLLYAITANVTFIGALVKLPLGTVGDICMPIVLQFAGMYPTIVIILVSLQRPTDIMTQWHVSIESTDPTDAATDSQTPSSEIELGRSSAAATGQW